MIDRDVIPIRSVVVLYFLLVMVAITASLEAQTRPLPKPRKVRVVSIDSQPSPKNQPPLVSASASETIVLPASATLKGTVTDDGLPRLGTLTQTWSKLSGPGTVAFDNASATSTTASFSSAGNYVLRLTASDSALVSTADVRITAKPTAAAAGSTTPILPQIQVDTTYVRPSGRTISVAVGGNFQAALNDAQPGDVITLTPGATYSGPFTLPVKSGSGWIVVRSATADGSLPAAGTRVTPAIRHLMARILGPAGNPAIITAPGAHHFRFIAIEFAPQAGTYNNGLVRLGTGSETKSADFPHHIILDRCYIHGDPATGGKRGVMFSGNSLAVIDSYLSDWKGVGHDTQAIAGWTGNGPWAVINNYLEAAGENMMVGGADPAIVGLVPSDIEVRNNTFSKPLEWNPFNPAYDGSAWSIKNLFELKNARRVLIADNLFQHNWVAAQSGRAILFTVKDQDGFATWSTIEDVTFVRNTIRRSTSGITISGDDGGYPSAGGRRFLIKDNVLVEIGGAEWGEGKAPSYVDSILFALTGGVDDLTIDHNTAIHTGSIIIADGAPYARFICTNNIVQHNSYGIKGSGYGVGNATLAQFFPSAVVRRNVMVGANATAYPADNYYPKSLAEVGFINVKEDLRLDAASPYVAAATEGIPIGAQALVPIR